MLGFCAEQAERAREQSMNTSKSNRWITRIFQNWVIQRMPYVSLANIKAHVTTSRQWMRPAAVGIDDDCRRDGRDRSRIVGNPHADRPVTVEEHLEHSHALANLVPMCRRRQKTK